jgi:exopolysaccharide biosynthesis polyprenyl glycosylphosphotransferase
MGTVVLDGGSSPLRIEARPGHRARGIHDLRRPRAPAIPRSQDPPDRQPLPRRRAADPDLFPALTLRGQHPDLDGFPVIPSTAELRGSWRFLKRLADIVVSGLSLLVLAPFFLLFAVLIKLSSRGPVFYHQPRLGIDGRSFTIHKFRTMVCDAEKETGPVMCRPDDERVTRIGRFLRRFSIDELPQLVNIFKGEMSLVGPRPERPEFVREFTERIPKYMLRHKVKSGLTGWAQVHGLRQGTSIEKRLEYDFYYIQNWSFGLDIKILWMTLRRGFIDRSMI